MPNTIEDVLDVNDFAVRLSPHIEDGEWNGDVQLTIISTANNNLDEEDFSDLMSLATIMCASLPLAEENEAVRKALLEYVGSMTEQEQPKRTTEGNVIHVAFNQNKDK